jgi:hypothetical protein
VPPGTAFGKGGVGKSFKTEEYKTVDIVVLPAYELIASEFNYQFNRYDRNSKSRCCGLESNLAHSQ